MCISVACHPMPLKIVLNFRFRSIYITLTANAEIKKKEFCLVTLDVDRVFVCYAKKKSYECKCGTFHLQFVKMKRKLTIFFAWVRICFFACHLIDEFILRRIFSHVTIYLNEHNWFVLLGILYKASIQLFHDVHSTVLLPKLLLFVSHEKMLFHFYDAFICMQISFFVVDVFVLSISSLWRLFFSFFWTIATR